MTKVQAIKRMYDLINTYDVGIERHGAYDDLFKKDKEAIETVLSMLKEKDKEIEKLEKENDLAKEQLKKQCEIADERNNLLVKVNRLESQIDLMAEYIANRDNDEDICKYQVAEWCEDEEDGVLIEVCRKCIKQYFERKVEEC